MQRLKAQSRKQGGDGLSTLVAGGQWCVAMEVGDERERGRGRRRKKSSSQGHTAESGRKAQRITVESVTCDTCEACVCVCVCVGVWLEVLNDV